MDKIGIMWGENFWVRIPLKDFEGKDFSVDDIKELHAVLESGYGFGKVCAVEMDVDQASGLAVWVAAQGLRLGTYSIVIFGRLTDDTLFRLRGKKYVRLVGKESQADAERSDYKGSSAYYVGDGEIITVLGREGLSAYEIAVLHGFDGDEEAWLESLKGDAGEKGDKGDAGEKGDKGDTGEKGDKGDTGEKGDTGATGPQGPQGNSGYQGAVGELEVVNNLVDGGETAALSAEMGKRLSENLQNLEEENMSYRLIYNDELFTFATTSSSKSKYYIREIPFETGKTYRVTFTLDAAKSNRIDLYLANQTTMSASLARILIGSMQAGETTKTIMYTCNDATMIYPSIYIGAATSGSFVIVVEEAMPANDAIEATNDRIDDTTIIKEEVVTDGIIEFSGLGISATTWTQETQRTLQAISVKDVARVTITASDTNPAYYCFLTSLEKGVGVPVYYCRGYHSYTSIGAGTPATIDVPPLAQYILFNKSYGDVVYAPKSVSFARKTNALTLASSLLVDSINGEDYANRHWTINTSNKWASSTGVAYSKFIPLQAGTYKIDAVNGIAIYAVLKSVNPVDGGTPDWADGYGQRYSIAYGGTAQITAQDGWWLVVRADVGDIPAPSGARTPAITNLSDNKIDVMQSEIDANKKPSNTIIIAASDSSDVDKKRADLVCTGTDDNKVIESAINMLDKIGTIYLCDGSYYVTSFTQDTDGTYVGITIPGINSALKTVNIEGYQFGGVFHQSVKIIVPQSVYDTLDSNANYSIIRHKFGTNGYNLGYLLSIKHIKFEIYSNQKKTVAVDCICSGQITMEDCEGIITTQPGVWGAGDSGLDPIPSLDCVFFKGLFGSAHAFAKISNCMATGYGIGFGIQGEHIISESCGAINCVYGFAFNYFPDLNHGSGVPGMYTHPMMIINPIEEGCLNLPYFGNNTLKQSIIITGYHNELRPKFFNQGGNYATEKVAGTWYGHVDYVIQFFPDSHSHGNEPHVVDKPFWANGSGINMESQNYAQKRLVTTTERLTYAPNYLQQVFDLTANKLLICTDPANKVWVDADGVQV